MHIVCGYITCVVKIKTKHNKELIHFSFGMEMTFGEEGQRDGIRALLLLKRAEGNTAKCNIY